MKNKSIYLIDSEYFDSSPLHNPIRMCDCNIANIYPDLYEMDYDLKILSTKSPTESEKSMPFYNDYRDKYGIPDISAIDQAVNISISKNVFLNGFDQKEFDYIVPMISDSTEILYLFKCPEISDLSALSKFKKLKGLFVFYNNSLQSLWNMKQNHTLKIISFVYVTKLQKIDSLLNSSVEYINFDSSDNYGKKKDILFDKKVFAQIPTLKHLLLTYK